MGRREDLLEQRFGLLALVGPGRLDQRDRPRQRPALAGEQALRQILEPRRHAGAHVAIPAPPDATVPVERGALEGGRS
jgi:hypothetical protein